ncbi:hypothetical protein [Desulfosarcina ovata]|uniref:hypothetical protein n=1 Tax=Desulfosarcina ovata TaxID=83564 RepID=UPI0012D31496|nr:hypothetical protein [Desulfosarcina ovata]
MRKPFCRHYPSCLNRAARSNTDFDCTTCPRYRPAPYHATLADVAGSLALLIAMECPGQYRDLAGRPDFRIHLLRAMVAVLRGDR